jgi:hypothetical protein
MKRIVSCPRMVIAVSLLLAGILLWTGCSSTSARPRRRDRVSVEVGHDKNVRLAIATHLAASVTDQPGAPAYVPGHVLERLNALSEEHGNNFMMASGETPDLILRFNIRGEGERYAGSVNISTPESGLIATLDTGQGAYATLPQLISALTDKVYVYIHHDWHRRY